MIRINLLPIRQIKQRIQTKNEVIAFVGLFCVLLVVLGIVGFTQASKIEDLQKTKAQLVQEKIKYENVIKRIAKIKKEKALLETKLDVIKNLKADSQLPVRVLNEIAQITPSNRMWLKSLKYASGSVSLTGIALDNATIAQYMDSLTDAPYFSSAELKNSSMTMVANQKLKSFSLSIVVTKPDVTKTSE